MHRHDVLEEVLLAGQRQSAMMAEIRDGLEADNTSGYQTSRLEGWEFKLLLWNSMPYALLFNIYRNLAFKEIC